MKMNGAKIFVESLKKEGVDTIFGYPGGVVLYIYDELYHSDIRHILVRHEQGAAHMADGYARTTGKVGVALVTSGPGATNTVTGIATAYMDSIPIVVFTGQVSTNLVGNDAFQEADIVGITRSCTKHNFLIKNVKDMARTIKEAFYIAKTGRPGPVVVDIPKDVTIDTTEFSYPDTIDLPGYKPTYEGHTGQIKRAIDMVLASRKPVIYTGGGIISSGSSKELLTFTELLGAPITNTLMGLGGFPGDHPLFMGMLGMHGTYAANMAVTHTDMLIAIGARFDDRVTGDINEFAPDANIVHIDIDPTSISKNVEVDIPIVGNAKQVLVEMNRLLKQDKRLKSFHSEIEDWKALIRKWQEAYPLTYKDTGKLKPQFVIERLYELTKGNAIITTEVGQNQMWTAQFYKFRKPRTFVTSGGLGTMGYGFPAAIGAKIAMPDVPVIDVAGDGSIQMNIQELATAVQYKVNVIAAILNNNYLGMVRQWQSLFYGKRYSHTRMSYKPDFVKLADAYGAKGYAVDKEDDVVPVLKEALRSKLPVLIDFHVEEEEDVYPIVPAGASLKKMLLA
ncbi:MAG: biosynthetic-type acetolactate synthase large subunit [Deltaproteobacteria bacterium]|nr:biosynthetic-type acetolactate synthase large subunit [Deltaproteobacteria bacterium]MCL5278239.1 biosynthetic-type acetolactate synthase large subunit [Deltaproteobacteria bacterium]